MPRRFWISAPSTGKPEANGSGPSRTRISKGINASGRILPPKKFEPPDTVPLDNPLILSKGSLSNENQYLQMKMRFR